ncbi:MAG: NAD-dependent epimerase/dehydratase family protein [Acidobacteria bacterium]|nr:NAD-dependent epimerase/dehydratase family protein [Acidobacteriota bacterium]MBI3655686.1 NAD-dependent epimerase/dehydratase family protein [Acidobacteriota bacterium]
MRILITGAAGLYGVHLVDELVKKDYVSRVIGVDDFSRPFAVDDVFFSCPELAKKFLLMRGRFQDISVENFDAWDIDVVVHLAAGVSIPESMNRPEDYFFNNEYGTFKLIHTLVKTKKHPTFIYASSPEVYGNPCYVPMDINHPMDPRSTYAVTKLAAEKHCKAIHDWYGYPVTIVRNFNTYGENQNTEDYSAVTPAFIKNALLGEPLRIEGDGTQTRDFMYVRDAVNAYTTIIEKPQESLGQIFNIGTGKQTCIRELAETIVDLANSSSPIIYAPGRTVDLFSLEADISKTTQLTGWVPKFTLREGLRRVIDWYNKFVLCPANAERAYAVVPLKRATVQHVVSNKS